MLGTRRIAFAVKELQATLVCLSHTRMLRFPTGRSLLYLVLALLQASEKINHEQMNEEESCKVCLHI